MTGLVMGQVVELDAPASKAFAITPNDSTDLTTTARAIYVGTTGNLAVTLSGDSSSVTFTNVAAGYHPLRAKRVLATGTTASGLIGLA
jgi:hypothetical protein